MATFLAVVEFDTRGLTTENHVLVVDNPTECLTRDWKTSLAVGESRALRDIVP